MSSPGICGGGMECTNTDVQLPNLLLKRVFSRVEDQCEGIQYRALGNSSRGVTYV